MSGRILVAVSACLLGERVRFDGGHKRDPFVAEALAEVFDWFPVCPEIELGLGAPRESLRLVDEGGGARLVAPRSGRDHTAAMRALAERRVREAIAAGARGWILKKDSPSCGLQRVRVYGSGETPRRDGSGLFAAELRRLAPSLPCEEEGRLQDARLRESFVTRVLVYDRWRQLRDGDPGRGDLVAFHRDHKLLLLAHDPARYRVLGRLVGSVAEHGLEAALDAYEPALMAALSRPTSPGRHANAIQHALGFLDLPAADRRELLVAVEEYRQGWVPLAVPMALLRHHLREGAHPWLAGQVYLEPHPRRLGLWSR